MDAIVFSFEHKYLRWIGKVQCTFQSQVFYSSAVSTDGMVVAFQNLECAKSLLILNVECLISFIKI
jgi:hypothetical protein